MGCNQEALTYHLHPIRIPSVLAHTRCFCFFQIGEACYIRELAIERARVLVLSNELRLIIEGSDRDIKGKKEDSIQGNYVTKHSKN